jgi:hypothetical protein
MLTLLQIFEVLAIVAYVSLALIALTKTAAVCPWFRHLLLAFSSILIAIFIYLSFICPNDDSVFILTFCFSVNETIVIMYYFVQAKLQKQAKLK